MTSHDDAQTKRTQSVTIGIALIVAAIVIYFTQHS
jgi:hypothetical protein